MTRLFISIGNLKGVGEKRLRLYQKLGIETPYDLLYYLPRDYRDYREPLSVEETEIDTYAVVRVTITAKRRPFRSASGVQVFAADAVDAQGTPLGICIFNNIYGFQALEVGKTYTMYGKIGGSPGRKEILSPRLHREEDSEVEAIYPQTAGLTSAMIRTNVRACLAILDESPFETIPPRLRRKYGLVTLVQALHQIHEPQTLLEAEEARRRLAFEEMLRLQLGLHLMKKASAKETKYPMRADTDLAPFYHSLPFTLTNAQQRAIEEITADLSSGHPMNRLLQGDVGSGKTAVAAAACYFCAANGYQSVMMAPTEILAGQHARTLSEFLMPSGISVGLLTGGMKAKERREVCEKIQSGAVQVIVGTHAVFQKTVEYHSLGLVITDEQHRFGVAQRTALAQKGDTPHKLVMSATPIPRTLALLMYGDLEVSLLEDSPAGRQPVETYAVTGKLRPRALRFLIGELQKGRQAYIVCPSIEEGELGLQSVTAYAEKLREGALRDWRTDLLHGQMSTAEKDAAMEKFRLGETDVLICTTVVEVGVDVPNATVMMVEDAERFGLSQLHQLRGRVGRGAHRSYCILITEHPTPESRERLKILAETTNGFEIAQADLELRGPGDFFGNRQHGLPPLKLANLADTKMIQEVQEATEEILSEDPDLTGEEHRSLRLEITRLFAKAGENGLN